MRDDTHKTEQLFAICVRNHDYPASLEVRKLYQVIQDQNAGQRGLVRVIDESGEDYLNPDDYFFIIELPQSLKDTLLASQT